MRHLYIPALLTLSVAIAGCRTLDPYTGEERTAPLSVNL